MKYRRLTQEELSELEPEFVRFLASNQITATDWEKLKASSSDKVDGLIEIFSDIVYDKILDKVEYMLMKHPRDLRTYKFTEDKVLLIGLLNKGDNEGNTSLDFTRNDSPEEMLMQMHQSKSELRLYTAERKYKKDKKQEVFQLMKEGALISKDGAMYKTLYNLRSSQLN